MNNEAININDKFQLFNDLWTPKIIAQMNNYHLKLAKMKGDFTWHDHKDTDEVFFVIDGNMRIDFRDHSINLQTGELFVILKGIEHKPFSENECKILIIEPADTVNTGEAGGEQTAPNDVWI